MRSLLVPTLAAAALLFAVTIYFVLRPRRSPEQVTKPIETAQNAVASVAPKSAQTSAAVPQTEAQKLIARLWEIHELEQDATPEEWALAEDLGAQAVKLEPNNADAWAAYSVATWGNGIFNHLPLKSDEAQRRASRAFSLAPDSFEARLAVANLERRQANTADHAERLLRQLVAERPDDKRALRKLSYTLRDRAARAGATSMPEEAFTLLDRAAALPGGDASALVGKALLLMRYADQEASIDAALKLRNGPNTLAFKMLMVFQLHGKLDDALALLKQAPSSFWVKPGKTATVAWLWLCHRDPTQALAALGAVQSDFLNGDSFGAAEFVGPRSALIGQAHQMAGNIEAAQLDWQAALRVVDQRLLETANDTSLYFWKAWLLASLGRNAEARAALKLYEQFSGRTGPRISHGLSWRPDRAEIYLKLGERAAVVEMLEQREQLLRKEGGADEAAILRNRLTYDPAWDLLRGDARFEALILRLAEFSAKSPSTAAVDAAIATKPDEKSAPADKSVAVLAFADNSPGRDSEYFSDGISEELLNVLAKVPGLKVTARTSAFFFKGKNLPIPEIAQKLNVAYVIEGSVQRAGDSVRITAQLIKASDGYHVWSDHFDRELKNVFALQDEIAGLIAKNLSLKLGVTTAARRETNPAAYEAYLQAWQASRSVTADGFAVAKARLHDALKLDPEFVDGYALLARVSATEGSALPPFDATEKIRPSLAAAVTWAERAVQLDPDSPDAHFALGFCLAQSWRNQEAEREIRRLLALSPSNAQAHALFARELEVDGRMDEVLLTQQRATELDPLRSRTFDNFALMLEHAGRFTDGLAAAERALVLQPDNEQALCYKAQLLIATGQTDAAIPIARRITAMEKEPAVSQNSPAYLCDILAKIGFRDEAQQAYARIPGAQGDKFFAAMALGRRDEALALLTSLSLPKDWADEILWNPLFDPVRTAPEFVAFLKKLGLTEAHARAQAWRKAHPPEKLEAKK